MQRAAIFVFWEKDGIVRDFIVYYLKGLQEVAQRVIVVLNVKINAEGRSRLESMGITVLVRENEGVDFWAYKTALDYDINNIEKYDEIVLANCSCYGPIYPFSEMFGKMQSENCDFWGVTEWPYGAGGHEATWILSYFMVFRKSMFLSYEWKVFWQNLSKVSSREECIYEHEIKFTPYFADKGFTYKVYCKNEPYYMDMTIESPDSLIIGQRCPLLKRKAFCADYSRHIDLQRGDVAKKAFNYIREKSLYDTNLILDDLLATQNYYHLKNSLHLNYFLPSDYTTRPLAKTPKVALCFHVYYGDLLDGCIEYMSSMPDYADIYITTPKEDLLESVKAKCKKAKLNNVVSIRLINARGRAESAFLVACKDFILQYDYACIVHDKLTERITPTIIGKEFGLQNLDSLLKTKDYVNNIIELFQNEPRLGMLVPVNTIHSIYRDVTYGNEWGGGYINYDGTVGLLKKLGIDLPLDKDIPPICPMGAMFWFRPDSMRKLIARSWEYDDFEPEPLPVDGALIHIIERTYPFVVQDAGYLTGWVSDIWDAEVHLTNIAYLYRKERANRPMNHGQAQLTQQQPAQTAVATEDYSAREMRIIQEFTNSRSWKITKPLRSLGRLLRKIKRKLFS